MKHVLSILSMVEATVQDTARTDVVVGKPLVFGDVTIVPLSQVSVGFGGGGGRGKAESGGEDNVGGGAGGSARVRPVAVAVFTKAGVKVHPIPDKKGKLEKLVDSLPDLVAKVRDAVGDDEDE